MRFREVADIPVLRLVGLWPQGRSGALAGVGFQIKGLPRGYPRTALRMAKQLAAEVPHLPIKVEEPAVSVPKPDHTTASVFANLPGGEETLEAAPTAEKPGRKRFAQQSGQTGRKRPATRPM